MPRWALWLPLGAVIAAVGLYAFRLGWIAANITETDAINAYAARYLETAGGDARPSDCVAFPGRETWLIVRCGRDGTVWEYHVNRFGGLVREVPPGSQRDPGPAEPRA